MYQFGAGKMFGIDTTGTVPIVTRFGTLQEVSVDFAGDIKQLFGQNKYADAVAQGQVKVTGKAKWGKITAQAYNTLFFNGDLATGMTCVADDEPGVIPSATAYTIQVKNNTTYAMDLGVIYEDTGIPLTRVETVTAAGQYSVTAGTYTFHADDAGKGVYTSYGYTSTSGKTITLRNSATGNAVTWKGVFNGVFSGKQTTMILNSCVSSKLNAISTKVEDFNVPELDFSASVDSSGILGKMSFAE